MLKRHLIQIDGIVQGVGFRPFVFRLAKSLKLTGSVLNSNKGVTIEVEGLQDNLTHFQNRLRQEMPPLAQITDFNSNEIPLKNDERFIIMQSEYKGDSSVLISPDMSLCEDCMREMLVPGNRRFHYPFLNCTNCGPRFTIISDTPYDRVNTSMIEFQMCEECDKEYHDPADRRFHAQPNACPKCGPQYQLFDREKRQVNTNDPVKHTKMLLRTGRIVALRGLGGYHLVVDAKNTAAIEELRERKRRAEKPFALMAANADIVEKHCQVSHRERLALQQQTRPIVLLQARYSSKLPKAIAPKSKYYGFMLPYLPLHHLLMLDEFEVLVMTSANYSDEPIVTSNQQAFDYLAPLADYFLIHNREILQRCDDSIIAVSAGHQRILRRSRGYVPAPIILNNKIKAPILAVGAELKNTVALSNGNKVVLSQHIGDLDNPEAIQFFKNSITHMQKLLNIKPHYIACDMHPEYLSRKWAYEQPLMPKIEVQHHHAHLASVMAENDNTRKTIGIILDGTGYGTDKTIWGGEVLIGDMKDVSRYAWFEPVPMPGGEAAIRDPWRMAISYLQHAFGSAMQKLTLPVLQKTKPNELNLLLQVLEKEVNSPKTSSCGRLFDAIASILDIRHSITYEAQAAIELEMSVRNNLQRTLAYPINYNLNHGALNFVPLIREIVNDKVQNVPVDNIAARFHVSLAEMLIAIAIRARKDTGIAQVGLSGGVYQNFTFFQYLVERLRGEGFKVLTHSKVPPNDGGLSLGQIAVANARL
ncbi:MAG: carbamoyltransferase HypF [Deferribacteres bacterium]|nr:carbamoyltransferase HypF [candidate division KSB1 bacterium]MCB9502068.1 carbamoyltransferase HypF [Deferribacteres bacterium]